MTSGVTPELSVAVGSVHDTTVEVVPTATLWVIGSGHPLTTGGTLSIVVTACVNNGRDLRHKDIFINNQCLLTSIKQTSMQIEVFEA